MAPKTTQELLSAPIDSLSEAEISRRMTIVALQKAERELEVVQAQNQEYVDQKETKERMAKAKTESIKAEQQRQESERRACKHKTGGLGMPGILNGDGDIYGYAVARQVLPTGEVYGLCFRCQKEWHMPSKRAVIDGRLSLIEYVQQEKEYNEMLKWPAKTFDTPNGELAGSIRFNIPALQKQRQKDDADFAEYLGKLPPNALAMAGIGVALVEK